MLFPALPEKACRAIRSNFFCEPQKKISAPIPGAEETPTAFPLSQTAALSGRGANPERGYSYDCKFSKKKQASGSTPGIKAGFLRVAQGRVF
jgi:hypothetical protein